MSLMNLLDPAMIKHTLKLGVSPPPSDMLEVDERECPLEDIELRDLRLSASSRQSK